MRPTLYALAGALAAMLITTTSALAGSGVGGVFNLGQTNVVDGATTLVGNPAGNPLLRLIGLGTAATLRADAGSGIAVNGISTSGTGQFGQSTSGIGLQGVHTASTGSASGVFGHTNSTDPGSAGVTGRNLAGGPGLQAIVTSNSVAPLKVNSSARVQSLNSDLLDGLDSTGLPYWKLGGNAGTTPGANFLGTTDNKALELEVNKQRALRLEPTATSPNVIGGFSGNSVDSGSVGSVIGGGGKSILLNHIADDFAVIGGGVNNTASGFGSTVGGGESNTASGLYSTVAGGLLNTASGVGSVASGRGAKATHDFSFVWGGAEFAISSTGNDSFTVGADGGVSFFSGFDENTGIPTAGVQLFPGNSSWSSVSDRASKHDFEQVDRADLLRRLARIPITRWSYKTQDPSIRHIGPMAQDVWSAFGLGESDRRIDTIDADGIALAAIQGLYRHSQALQRENRSLNARITKLEKLVGGLTR
jgi:hypothetical protein